MKRKDMMISAEHTIELRKILLFKSIEMQIAEYDYNSSPAVFVLSLERVLNTAELMFDFVTNK